jgi:hypothetical protein
VINKYILLLTILVDIYKLSLISLTRLAFLNVIGIQHNNIYEIVVINPLKPSGNYMNQLF